MVFVKSDDYSVKIVRNSNKSDNEQRDKDENGYSVTERLPVIGLVYKMITHIHKLNLGRQKFVIFQIERESQ